MSSSSSEHDTEPQQKRRRLRKEGEKTSSPVAEEASNVPEGVFSDGVGSSSSGDEKDDVRDDNINDNDDNDDGEMLHFSDIELPFSESELSEGEDLMETMEKDYRYDERLDRYDAAMLDETAYQVMDHTARRAAEEVLRRREKERQRGEGRVPMALRGLDETDDEDEGRRGEGRGEGMTSARRKRRAEAERAAAVRSGLLPLLPDGLLLDDDYDDDDALDLSEPKGPLREWIVMDRTRHAISKKFWSFLTTFVDKHGTCVYADRVKRMCGHNKSSLEVDYTHLSQVQPFLAVWAADAPTQMLEIFDDVAMQFALSHFPDYRHIHPEISVRITGLPIADSLRDIRQIHLNALIKVVGVVTRRTSVFPQLKIVRFNCGRCGHVLGPYHQSTAVELRIDRCNSCQSRGPFRVNTEQSVYRNYQKITLQESPGSVPPGRLPRTKDVILLGDLIDMARPGEEVEVTGIFKNNFDVNLNFKNGFPVFATIIEANYIAKKDDVLASAMLTAEDEFAIRALSREPGIAEKVRNSIAPSIFGHEDIKLALMLSLFGGEAKEVGQKHRIRGDINVLLLGDPGTAKSQV
jgi:DNA replication licensing factor MCM2